jgi:hypothetical protein
MLQGKDVPHAHFMWSLAKEEFKSLLDTFRDMAPNKEKQPVDFRLYHAFRNSVQSIVKEVPPMEFIISPTREYTRTMILPRFPGQIGPSPDVNQTLNAEIDLGSPNIRIKPLQTFVTLTPQQLVGYQMVVEHIGLAGEPMIRAILDRFPDEYGAETVARPQSHMIFERHSQGL